MDAPINNKLSELKKNGRLPFHMPGHKRKDRFSSLSLSETGAVHHLDTTEISGYDDLHHPQGIIRESMDILKEIYHTRESWYLVNGSTVGILAAISAVCRPGEKIVIGRNCHKSVYNALRLLRLEALYLYPSQDQVYDISLDIDRSVMDRLRDILNNERGIRAVVLTSPTYEGVVSDICSIRKIISDYDDRIPLIIDEAHGAHMYFHKIFPASAMECGADIVIQSTHKTLPAMTQTALLHLCSNRVEPEKIQQWLSVYESSSPSYILMASAEASVIFMHKQGKKVQKYVDNLASFRKNCGQLMHIQLIGTENLPVFDFDRGKLVFGIAGKKEGGQWLFSSLRDKWNIELEMQNRSYAVAMTSVMDEKEDFDHLWRALVSLDQELEMEELFTGETVSPDSISYPEKKMEAWECDCYKSIMVPLSESTGQIAASYVMIYPPGIPLLVPGEKIMKEMVEKLKEYLYNGYNVQGMTCEKIPVLIV